MVFNLIKIFNKYKLSHIGVMATLFGASTSISLINIGFLLVLLGIIFEGNFKERFLVMIESPMVLPLVLLMLWGFIGATYSDAEADTLSRQLKIFAKIGLILMVIIAADNVVVIDRAWAAFIFGACFTLISTYLNIYILLPWSTSQNLGWGPDHTVFYNYISQSIVFAFAIGYGLIHILEREDAFLFNKLFWIIFSVLSLISMLFLSTGRVGIVALAFVMIYLVAFRFKLRGVLVLMSLGLIVLHTLSGESGVVARLAVGIQDIQNFQGIQDSQTSWGARLSMYLLSINFITQAPLFGHGLGDYQTLAMAFYELPSMRAVSGDHPHNQYLYLFVELGIIGLGLYLWLHFSIFRSSRNLTKKWRQLANVFLIVLVVGSMFHAPFWMAGERNFFFPLIGLLAANGIHRGRNTLNQ
jgi:O-antigen ligase